MPHIQRLRYCIAWAIIPNCHHSFIQICIELSPALLFIIGSHNNNNNNNNYIITITLMTCNIINFSTDQSTITMSSSCRSLQSFTRVSCSRWRGWAPAVELFNVAFEHTLSFIPYTLQNKVSPIFLRRDKNESCYRKHRKYCPAEKLAIPSEIR